MLLFGSIQHSPDLSMNTFWLEWTRVINLLEAVLKPSHFRIIWSPSFRAKGSYYQAFGVICKGKWKFLETPRCNTLSFRVFENQLRVKVCCVTHRETQKLSQSPRQLGTWSMQCHFILLTRGSKELPGTCGPPPPGFFVHYLLCSFKFSLCSLRKLPGKWEQQQRWKNAENLAAACSC